MRNNGLTYNHNTPETVGFCFKTTTEEMAFALLYGLLETLLIIPKRIGKAKILYRLAENIFLNPRLAIPEAISSYAPAVL